MHVDDVVYCPCTFLRAVIMAGEIIVAATFFQVRQQIRFAWSLTRIVRLLPSVAAHIMSQWMSCPDSPTIRS